MNFGKAFSSFFTNLFAKAENSVMSEIQHRDWTSIRWLALVALACLLVWNFTKQLMSPADLQILLKAFIVWTIGNTLTRMAVIFANAWCKVALIRYGQPGVPVIAAPPVSTGTDLPTK